MGNVESRSFRLSELAIAHVDAERATAEKPDPDAYNTPLGELVANHFKLPQAEQSRLGATRGGSPGIFG